MCILFQQRVFLDQLSLNLDKGNENLEKERHPRAGGRYVLLKKEKGVSQSQIIRTATGMGEGSQREEFSLNGVNKSFLCLWMTRVKTFKKQLLGKEKYGYPQERKAKMSKRNKRIERRGKRGIEKTVVFCSSSTQIGQNLFLYGPPFRPFIFIAFSACETILTQIVV